MKSQETYTAGFSRLPLKTSLNAGLSLVSQVKGQHPVAGELAPSPEPRQQETVPLLNGEGYPGAGSWCWAPQKNRVQREPPVQRTRSLGAAGGGGGR